MDEIIQEACKIVELKYASNLSGRSEIAEREYDLIVHFPPGRKEQSQAFLKGPAPLHRTSPSQGTTASPVLSATGFVLNGRRYYANSGIAILVGVLNELINLNPSFAERFVKSDFNFNLRKNWYRYLSQDRNDLQNPKPRNVKQLASGWWINRDLTIKTMDEIIQEACRVAEVKYGSDLIVSLPPGKNKIKAFPKGLSVPTPLHRTSPSQGTTSSRVLSARGFVLNGRRYYAKSGIAILVGVLNELIKFNPSFAERFVKSDFNFNLRKNWYRYLSKDRNDLQNPKPRNVRQLASGWWINDNLTIKMMDQIIQEACKIVELKYASNLSGRPEIVEGEYDLIVHFPPGR